MAMHGNMGPKWAFLFRKRVAPGEYELYESASRRDKVLCRVREVDTGIQLVYPDRNITLPTLADAMKRAYIIEFGMLR